MERTIYTRRMAVYLRNRGFTIVRTIPDEKVPNFFNWIFEDSNELQEAMRQYSAMNIN